MLRKAFIVLSIVALLWLSGCATVTPLTDLGDSSSPCGEMGAYANCSPYSD
jgi:uncharacterized protein YceK